MDLNILLYRKTEKAGSPITAICLEWGICEKGKDFEIVRRNCLKKTYDAILKYKTQKNEKELNEEMGIYSEEDEEYCGPKQVSMDFYMMLIDSTPAMEVPSYFGGTVTFWEHESTADNIQFDGPGPAYG